MFIDKLITHLFSVICFFFTLIAILILILIWNIICFERFFVHSLMNHFSLCIRLSSSIDCVLLVFLNTIIDLKT